MRSLTSGLAIGLLTALGTGVWHLHAQSTPAAALLARAGWEALQSGRIDDAADAFRRAIKDDPRDANVRLGAGLAAHLLGQPDEARLALEAALRLNPRLAEAAVLLGELAYRQGDLQRAMRTYEEALALAPEHGEMRDKLARWRREAALHDVFDRRISDNFTVLFEGPAEQPLAERALQILEAAYWRVASVLGIHPVHPITVVLYTSEQFRDITRAPAWAAGAFDGTIRVPVRNALDRPGELQRVLAHELTHALVWSVAPRRVPRWLDEGLAVVFEGEDLHHPDRQAPSACDAARHENFVRVCGPHDGLGAPQARPAGAERGFWAPASDGVAGARGAQPTGLVGHPLPLANLHGSFGGLTNAQAAVAYTQSGLAARALLDLIGGAGVANILADLAAGVEFDTAFARRAPLSYVDFQARWPELADAAPRHGR